MTRLELASELLDHAVRFLKHLPNEPEGTQRDTCRRAGQLLRLVSQNTANGTMSVLEAEAWIASAHLTLKRMEATRVGAY